MASSNSPCAACKFLRRKCMPECVFAPYFPPDNPQKFSNVHKVFGASNVSKILNDLSPNNREDAVSSLAFEAEFRLRDPVYGCVGFISSLQKRISQIQQNIHAAKKELASFIDPTAMLQTINNPHSGYLQPHIMNNNNHPSQASAMGFNMQHEMFAVHNPVSHSQQLLILDPQSHSQNQHQQMLETSQHVMMENFQQQQQQQHQQLQSHELVKFNNGYDQSGQLVGFNLMDPSPSLALGDGTASFEGAYNNNNNSHHHHLVHQQHEESKIQNLHFQSQLMLNQQQQQHQSSSQHAHDHMLLQPKSLNE